MQHFRGNVRDLLIEDEMRDSYLNYAMSVIISRALPDVRDGLKPSQRRLLVAMNELNLGPRSKPRKCGKIIGDTIGNYHPHGEQALYPTLVRMAQPFTFRYELVDGQGNFGSIDGDPPAAMRYTEARMSAPTMEMMDDIALDTVDYVPNYDETSTEPTVLPARFPNLLCNGSSGIAVGMSTSIPPHNLREVVDGLIRVIDEPEVGLDELMKIIKAPDFPTGGLICGTEGIRRGYETGRGSVVVRARAFTEIAKNGKKNIVFNEIPYQITRQSIREKVAALVNDGKITGIADVRDESDRNGQRLVIELKRGEDEAVVLNQLYKHSNLQDTFSIIMISLVNNEPRTLSLKEMLQCYVDHRVEVVRRRTTHLLRKAEARAHILEGLKIALNNIDEIIATIKRAPDVETAKQKLIEKFGLTDVQATHILQMQLQRLTRLERDKIDKEYRELIEKIAEYNAILASQQLVLSIIKDELLDLKDKYGDGRRTEIVSEAVDFEIKDLIAEEMVVVTISHGGYIKRAPLSVFRSQGRGGRGITGAGIKEGDFVEHLFTASTHDYILFFTNRGKVYWLKVWDIPLLPRTSKGRAVVNLLELDRGEVLTSMIPVREFASGNLVMATRNGHIKKTALKAFSRPLRTGIIAINLTSDDQLIRVAVTSGAQEIILGTAHGHAIRFRESDVRSMGRATQGVTGIRLRGDDHVVDMVIVTEETALLTVCENGYGKRTDFGEYSAQRRGGYGVIDIKTTARNGRVVALMSIREEEEVMMITSGGMIIRTPISSVRVISRNTMGVRLIMLKKQDHLVAVARVIGNGDEDEDEDEEPDVESG